MANQLDQFKVINLKHLAKVAKVDYTKLLNCLKGKYDSWDDEEKTRLYNAFHDESQKAMLVLGFTFDGKRVKRA